VEAESDMNFRLPQNLSTQLSLETGESVLNHEILAEQAASLGNAGRKVESTLKRLQDFDAGSAAGGNRGDLVGDAANAVWSFLVQRELVGMRDQDQVVKDYGIPPDVLARVGERKAIK
jgi:hypothetical protein